MTLTLLAAAPTLAPADLAHACVEGGYRPTAVSDRVVVAERLLPGGSLEDRRSVVFYRAIPEGEWIGSCHAWRLVEASPRTYDYHCLHRSGRLPSLDDVGLWIGGASSIPADRAEVRALEVR